MRELSPTEQSCVLDVGVTAWPRSEGANILEREWLWKSRLIAVSPERLGKAKRYYPQVRMTRADGCHLPLADESVDYVWSNAVIEHVGGIERQQAFVLEALRVASAGVFITTPYRWSPIESHTNLPFIHWLPKSLRDVVFRVLGFPWMREVFLLSKDEFKGLFPSGTAVRVIKQRVALIPYTLIATVRKS